MPLTPAERQKKYRERLKKENPEKYEEYKKKVAARSLLYYREKVSQCTEEGKEKKRQQWRDVSGNQTSPPKKQMPLTPAERQKKYRERLKKEKPEKYEEYKKKVAARALIYYREKASQYTEEEKEIRRQKWRDVRRNQTSPTKNRKTLTSAERQKKYRERLKNKDPEKYEEYKKKVAARSLLYYREKASKYTKEEKEKRRQQWRDMRRNQNSPANQRMPLTSAERQKKYRERLKKENPEKYEEIKKKLAENARRYYKKKAGLYTEDGTEKSGQQWRDATKLSSAEGEKEIDGIKKAVNPENHEEMIINVEKAKCNKGIASITQTTQNGVKKQARKRLTPAERQRRYREKLKRENPDKYLDFKKKSADNSRRYYRENGSNKNASLKRQLNGVRGKILSPSERGRRCREILKREDPAKYAELVKKNAETAKRYNREKSNTEEEREERRQKWREDRRLGKKEQNEKWKDNQDETQMSSEEESSSEEDAQQGPSERPMTPPWHSDSPCISDNSQEDPLCRLTDQCRFCGEFSKDCIVVSSHMTYLAGTKTTLCLNDINIQLDFDDGLPKTVCCNCDAKLQGYCDFIKSVKTAQETLKRRIKTEPEDVRGIEDVVIKTEADEEDVNSISISDTVFVKKTINCKRKGDVTKQKAKVARNIESEDEVYIDIKQETVDADEHIESSRLSDVGSETLSIPDELKINFIEIVDEVVSVSEVIKKERTGTIGSDTTVNATLSPQIVPVNHRQSKADLQF